MQTIASLTGFLSSDFGKEKKPKDIANHMFADIMNLGATTAPGQAPVGAFSQDGMNTQTASAIPATGKTYKAEKAYQNGSDTVRQFLDYQHKTPAEKLREKILAEMGLTSEAVENMPPEERAKIEAEVAERMKEKIEQELSGTSTKNETEEA